MLITTTGTGQDIISASVRALFNLEKEEQSSELYYQSLGFYDYEPDVPAEQLNSMSGPGKGILTVEGEQYGSNDKTRGLNWIVLVKFLLINGENLRLKAMATLTKQAKKIAVQVQRLSEETLFYLFYKEAIVWSHMKV